MERETRQRVVREPPAAAAGVATSADDRQWWHSPSPPLAPTAAAPEGRGGVEQQRLAAAAPVAARYMCDTPVRRHCRRHLAVWCLLIVSVGLVAAAWLSTQRQPAKLLLVLAPALRWDYLDRLPGRETPFFSGMLRGGAHAHWLQPGCLGDSVALTVTLLTGRYPSEHGVLGRHYMDRRLGDMHAEVDAARSEWWGVARPVWHQASQRMHDAAVYNVLGACTQFDDHEPRYCRSEQQQQPEEKELYHADDQQLLEHHGQQLTQDIDDALAKLATKHYHMAVVQSDMLHRAAQRHGATAPATLAALRALDLRLLPLLHTQHQHINVVVASWGGLTDTRHMRVIVLEEHVNTEQVPVTVAGDGGYCLIYTAARHQGHVHRQLANVTGLDVYGRHQLPARLRLAHERSEPTLLAVARPGYYIEHSRPLSVAAAGGFDSTLDHSPDTAETQGDNAKPDHDDNQQPQQQDGEEGEGDDGASVAEDMRGVLLARGPGIKSGVQTPPVTAVDVFALLAHLLWLDNTGSGSIDRMITMLT